MKIFSGNHIVKSSIIEEIVQVLLFSFRKDFFLISASVFMSARQHIMYSTISEQ